MSEQLELISSAFKVIETQRPKLACCRCDHIVDTSTFKTHCTQLCRSGASGPCCHRKIDQTICRYTASQKYTVVREWKLSRATLGRWTGAVAELLEPLYDVLRQYVLMPGTS